MTDNTSMTEYISIWFVTKMPNLHLAFSTHFIKYLTVHLKTPHYITTYHSYIQFGLEEFTYVCYVAYVCTYAIAI